MVKIPEEATKLKVELAVEGGMIKKEYRPYFGISGLGAECPRAAWYSFRWCTAVYINKRLQRLFDRGHREEDVVVADLENAGMVVHSRQIGATTGHGHISGHPDGIIRHLPDAPKTEHLLEIKTANDKNFKHIQKKGIKVAKYGYWAQAQGYMHLFKLKRALFVVVNKNDDQRYYERIKYEKKAAEELIQKAVDIISSEIPPAKIGNASWWACRYCDHYNTCHYDAKPPNILRV